MSKHVKLPIFVAVAALGTTTPLLAQGRSAVSSSELDAAIAAHPAGTRQAVQDFLATDQVKQTAARMGVSASDLSARVATLDQRSLNQIAAQAGLNDQALAGGATTIVVTSTVIIIALLILIIILVS